MSSRAKPAAAPARPAGRYFKGKAPKEAAESDSDDEEEEDDQDQEVKEEDASGADFLASTAGPSRGGQGRGMNVALGKMGVTKEGKVTGGKVEESSSEEETESEEEDVKPKFKAPVRPGQPPAADEGSSSEYETDSEEEEPAKPALRPTFVPKRARETLILRDAATLSKLLAEEEQRKKDSHDMVAESIRREIAEKEAPELITEVDDTDGLDPTLEFESWRLRELQRLARDEAASSAREEERDEVERRRAMPEQERMREDLERAEKGRREKPKGQQVFLQKFWHKGAFHQDDEILQRDYSAPLESTVDVSSLPKVMQKRNFGKMSQSKYTHLVDQDTTAKGFGGSGGGGQGCFTCGSTEHMKKDCPQNPWNQQNQAGPSTFGAAPSQGGGPTGTGSNGSVLGSGPSRSWGVGAQQQQPSSSSARPPPRDDRRGDDRDRRDDRSAQGWGRNEDVRRRSRSRSKERGGGGGRWDESRRPRDDGRRDEGRRDDRERDRDGGRGGGGDGGRRRERSRSRDRERGGERRRDEDESKRRRVD
ncbi:splicing factor, Prp19-binding domain-containing protein [Mrakia frigida]|uniref:splicing factor, Prp19-binding domain-containing protein n=1 Tax=Mrakia frigida TaxID=29902 RepID=UPI003FCC00AA